MLDEAFYVQSRFPNTYMRLDGLQTATLWASHNPGEWPPLLYVVYSRFPPWCHQFPSLWLQVASRVADERGAVLGHEVL